MRVMVGVSGGVDSAVALARLREAGHEVTAVHYAFSTGPDHPVVESARAVAAAQGVDFAVWDFQAEFEAGIKGYFEAEYAAGRTPNPCVRCNKTMKFGAVLGRAIGEGFDAVATGHYARVVPASDGSGDVLLQRGIDPTKDQSYVLAVLSQQQLRRCVFPLGGMTKAQVRAEAARRGLAVASTPDSLDICFIADGDTAGYLAARLGDRPGEVVDASGEVVGTHLGTHRYTVGQRKGLRLPRPAADGRPRYVLGVEPATNVVTVGPRDALRVEGLTCSSPNWTRGEPAGPLDALVQVRAHGEPMPARVTSTASGVSVTFATPAYGIAPGQAAVFFAGDTVLGMATIDATS